MSELSRFMKSNKKNRENAEFTATKSLTDENGAPLKWELRPLSSRENEAIREACTREIPVPGKTAVFRQKIDLNAYIARMIASSVVRPDLFDAALQDSYGVKTPEDLLREMVDDPGEYQELALFVQRFNGFDVGIDERIEHAKN